jgi:hypothetical protein
MKTLYNYINEGILAGQDATLQKGDDIFNELDKLKNTVSDIKNFENKSISQYKRYKLEYHDCKNLLNSFGCKDCYISIEITQDSRGAKRLSQRKNMVFVWVMHHGDVVKLSNYTGSDEYSNIKAFIKGVVAPIFNDYNSFSNFIHRNTQKIIDMF